jgi:hypothetical protein
MAGLHTPLLMDLCVAIYFPFPWCIWPCHSYILSLSHHFPIYSLLLFSFSVSHFSSSLSTGGEEGKEPHSSAIQGLGGRNKESLRGRRLLGSRGVGDKGGGR